MNKALILFISLTIGMPASWAEDNCSTAIVESTSAEVIENSQTEVDRILCAQTPSVQNETQLRYAQSIHAQAELSTAAVSDLNPDLHQAATIFDSQAHMIYENPDTNLGPKDLEELRHYNANNKVVLDLMSRTLPGDRLNSQNFLSIQQFNEIRQEMFRLANPSRFSPLEKMTEEDKRRLPLEDACYLRATMVAQYLAQHFPHLPVMKTWLLTDKAFEFEDKTWVYHVSPFVPVQVGNEIKWMALDTITLGQEAMDVEQWVDFVIFKDKDDKRRKAPIKVEVTYSERLIPSTCILNLGNIQEKTEDWEALASASSTMNQKALRAVPVNPQDFQNPKKEGLFKRIFKKKSK